MMEADPDDQQRADHAEHARVELGGLEEPSDGAEFGCTRPVRRGAADRLIRGRVGHAILPPVYRLARMPEHGCYLLSAVI